MQAPAILAAFVAVAAVALVVVRVEWVLGIGTPVTAVVAAVPTVRARAPAGVVRREAVAIALLERAAIRAHVLIPGSIGRFVPAVPVAILAVARRVEAVTMIAVPPATLQAVLVAPLGSDPSGIAVSVVASPRFARSPVCWTWASVSVAASAQTKSAARSRFTSISRLDPGNGTATAAETRLTPTDF